MEGGDREEEEGTPYATTPHELDGAALETKDAHKEDDLMTKRAKKRKCGFFCSPFLVGLFNNNGFVLVQAGAHSLAKEFDEENFMAVFQFTMTGLSMLTRVANGTFLVNVKHLTRMRAVSAFAIVAFVLVAVASFES